MKRFVFMLLLVICSCFPVVALAKAKHGKVPKTSHVSGHFRGQGIWIWNEICLKNNDFAPYVIGAKAMGMKYVIVKGFDGCEWGVRNKHRRFQSQLSEPMIKAFHKAGIKCYGYGTAWLKPQSNVEETIQHAINILHKTSADGLVIDDVFAYGSNPGKTQKLFSSVRGHIDGCRKCRKKPLAFSTFPSVWRKDIPWDIPMRNCDYYLPQMYWADNHQTPDQTFRRFQLAWAEYSRSHRNTRAHVAPVAATSGKTVTPSQIQRYMFLCSNAGYDGVSFFRWDSTSVAEWRVIRKGVKKKRV